MPVYQNAFSSEGVHVITVNEYLQSVMQLKWVSL
ncbi:MAG: hypothetical protein ACLS36_03275 [Streptococcus sp.]